MHWPFASSYSAQMALRLLVASLFFLVLAFQPTARAADVAVVLSDTGGAYTEFATAFQQFSEGSGWRIRWTGSVDSLEGAPHTDVIIAVGSEALRASLRRNGGIPILATLLPRPAFEKVVAEGNVVRPKGSLTAIYLDQPVGRLLAFTRQILPDRRRIGLLVGAETRHLLPQIRNSANGAGLSVESEEVDVNANPVTAANYLLLRSDVLLALPDSTIYRRENVRAILLTSYRFQRPVIGFSPSFAASGALAAIYSTPTQIARQTADMIRTLHPEGINLPAPQTPALFAISVNQNVAQSLGLALPDEPSIRRAMAADKDAK